MTFFMLTAQPSFVAPPLAYSRASPAGHGAVVGTGPAVAAAAAARPAGGAGARAGFVPVALCACSALLAGRRHGKRQGVTARRAQVLGLGWTDEVARIMNPSPTGPEWKESLGGYRGRPSLRLLLDGEDLCYSYAEAEYRRTGKWTGPRSEGIREALSYGAWSLSEEEAEEAKLAGSPEILAFVGMPADMVQNHHPNNLVDTYPEALWDHLGLVKRTANGKQYVNEFLAQLQQDGRLIAWRRPQRDHGRELPNCLIQQKYWKSGEAVDILSSVGASMDKLLSQVVGSGSSLNVGDEIEALRPGRLLKDDSWQPAQWKEAKVEAVNYDGSYDIKFKWIYGPYREIRRDLPNDGIVDDNKPVKLPSSDFDTQFYDWGADWATARYRLAREMDYAMSVPPSRIRLPGTTEVIGDTMDGIGNQDWFLCTSKQYRFRKNVFKLKFFEDKKQEPFEEFKRRFIFSYRWEPTPEGCKFVPVLTSAQQEALRANHTETAKLYGDSGENLRDRRQLESIKAKLGAADHTMSNYPKPPPAKPSRAAGPLEAHQRKSLAQKLAAQVSASR